MKRRVFWLILFVVVACSFAALSRKRSPACVGQLGNGGGYGIHSLAIATFRVFGRELGAPDGTGVSPGTLSRPHTSPLSPPSTPLAAPLDRHDGSRRG
jgi:hypothetical protein